MHIYIYCIYIYSYISNTFISMIRFDIEVTKLWEKRKKTLFYEIKNVNIQVF